MWEIGLLGLELERDHGWTDIEFAALFTGLSNASTAPGKAQDVIVKLIADANGLDTLAHATSLNDVRKISTTVGDAIDEYLDRWGLRAVRYEVAYPTVAERPDWLLRQLQEHRPREHDDDRARRDAAEQKLLAALGDTDETRARLKAARRAFPVREGNEQATVGLPLAVARRVGLGAGRRLVRNGNLERAEDVFDLTVNEVTALLRSGLIAPADPALRARTRREARAEADARVAPLDRWALDGWLARCARSQWVSRRPRPGHERHGLVHDEDPRRPAVGERGRGGIVRGHWSGGVAGNLRRHGAGRARRARARSHRSRRRARVPDHITGVVDGLPCIGRARVRRRRSAEPPRDHRAGVRHPRGGRHRGRNEHDP